MSLKNFQDKALTQFTREITDIFFGYIEVNKELFQDYMNLLGKDGNQEVTNAALKNALQEWFSLNSGEVNDEPVSFLIKHYREFEKK